MSMPPLNLASRPFRNERLPAFLLALGFTVVGAVSIKHSLTARSLLPGRTSGLARQVEELEKERDRLRREETQLRAPRPEASVLAQWTLLKDLVDGRTFSWSGLFALMEETLPKGVRLVSIVPSVEKGQRKVEMLGVARGNEDLLELIRVLEDRPEFDDVLPQGRGTNEQNLVDFRLTMKYRPPAEPSVVAAANNPAPASSPPSPEASSSASPDASPPSAAAPARAASAPPAVAASASPAAAAPEAPSLFGPSSPPVAPAPTASPSGGARFPRKPLARAPEKLEKLE